MNKTHVGSKPLEVADLARVDLNVLVAFDALARERSVTAAAHGLGITQSAMSHTLRRLRSLFGDALLVRGKRGMVLTPRAEALVVPLRSGLVTLGRALLPMAEFEPRSAQRTFRIASPDLFDVVAVPRLLERVRQEAPGVAITIVPGTDSRLSDHLETGDVDMAIVPQVKGAESESAVGGELGLVRRTLLRDRFACFVRAGNPALRRDRGKLSLESFVELSHVLISPSGEGPGLVDRMLEERGLRRQIALRVPHFYVAPTIVAQNDLILTAPKILERLVADLPLAVLLPPLPLPEHAVNLVWHQRFSNDPGHRWLRELVTEVGAGLAEPAARGPSGARSRRRP